MFSRRHKRASQPAKMARPAGRQLGLTAAYAAILSIAVAAGVYLDRSALIDERTKLRAALADTAYTLSLSVQRELVTNEMRARGISGSIAGNPDYTTAQFEQVASHLISNAPEVVNIAAAPGLVITDIFPRRGNTSVIGLDYSEVPDQLASVARALRSNAVVLDGPVNLVQGGKAFILRAPVRLTPGGNPKGSLPWGVVSIVIDSESMIARTGLDPAPAGTRIAVRALRPGGEGPEMIHGDADVFSARPVLRQLSLLGVTWQIGLAPEGGWPTAPTGRGAMVALIAAIALVVMIVVHIVSRLSRERDASRAQLFQAIESINDGFALYGPDDRLVMCNSKYCSYYNKSADQFVPGARFEDILREGLRRGQYQDAIGREEEWLQERLALHAQDHSVSEQYLDDGRWLKVAENRTPDGSTVGFRVDVTELKRAQHSAEQANRAKSDFLNNVSHELRTPLTVILGYSSFLLRLERLPEYARLRDLMEQNGDVPAIREAHETHMETIRSLSRRIDSAGQMLLSLINGVLDWSRIEAGEMNLAPEPVQVDRLVDEIGSQLQDLADSKGLCFNYSADEATVEADPVRLRQVLINLVGNAIKFTDSGHVALRAECDGDALTFTIEDSGCGIAPENHELVFERFKQVDDSITRAYTGTGLGLAITRQIVEAHGSRIRLDSVPGEGSIFRFALPVCTRTAKAA
ncbi:His Kinase A (phospho-acceptor) domain-containing protein [Tranquillimonas rosea]|uniref:histidine kinase n=2 Tax=Tranquillimonas rosea TaxID=641238 RepID=A0A1H9RBT1_9RHOB|nr:His Kinase A (phospho-acceptor) domain-containing protein [Tranquillimonas rosea]